MGSGPKRNHLEQASSPPSTCPELDVAAVADTGMQDLGLDELDGDNGAMPRWDMADSSAGHDAYAVVSRMYEW